MSGIRKNSDLRRKQLLCMAALEADLPAWPNRFNQRRPARMCRAGFGVKHMLEAKRSNLDA
jgi:hypothetical protein